MHTGNVRLDVLVSLPLAVYIVKRFVNLGVTPQGGSDETITSAAPDALLGSASGPAAGAGHSQEPCS